MLDRHPPDRDIASPILTIPNNSVERISISSFESEPTEVGFDLLVVRSSPVDSARWPPRASSGCGGPAGQRSLLARTATPREQAYSRS